MDGIGRDRLALRDVPAPQPGPGEVLVMVAAASLNYRDKLVIETGLGLPLAFPLNARFRPCRNRRGAWEGCCPVRHRRSRDINFLARLDRRRAGWRRPRAGLSFARRPQSRRAGGLRRFPEDWFVRAPTTLTAAEASALPCAGLTAWFALIENGKLHAGQTVLIEGTGGSRYLVCKSRRRTEPKPSFVSGSAREVGPRQGTWADHGIDRSREDWVEALLRLTGDHGADHILEVAGGAHRDQRRDKGLQRWPMADR